MNIRKKDVAAVLISCFSLFILILTGCKQSNAGGNEEKPRFVDIYIRFLVPENEYSAQIVFLEGDSAQNLYSIALPGTVTWNQKALRAKNLNTPQLRYELLQPGPFSPRNEFVFQETNGKSKTLSVLMDPIDNFRIGPTLSRTEGTTLILEGKPIAEGETLLLLLTDEQGNTIEIPFEGPRKSNTFKLTPQMLGSLQPGKHELYLVKQQQRESNQQQRSVYSMVEWYSEVKEVIVR